MVLPFVGMSIGFLVAAGFRISGLWHFDFGPWIWLWCLTAVVFAVLWLIAHFGWDEKWSFDKHYILVPITVSVLLLNTYGYILPVVRPLTLFGFFLGMFFMVGRASFKGAAAAVLAMATGYGATAVTLASQGRVDLFTELGWLVALLALGLYSAVLLNRTFEDRRHLKQLRKQLEMLAVTDALTGIPNRRYLETRIEQELSRLDRTGVTFAVAMMDIDHFKRFNDRHGHPAGDEVLVELGEIMRQELREYDVGARYGGEEFAVLLCNVDRNTAVYVMERIRRRIERHPFPYEAGALRGDTSQKLTISIGVAVCEELSEVEELFRRADAALYRAKGEGRNRVCM